MPQHNRSGIDKYGKNRSTSPNIYCKYILTHITGGITNEREAIVGGIRAKRKFGHEVSRIPPA